MAQSKQDVNRPVIPDGSSASILFSFLLMTGTLHIVLAMKPMQSGFVENALKHGVAGINVNGCRIGIEKRAYKGSGVSQHRYSDGRAGLTDGRGARLLFEASGRWPSNVILGHLQGCRPTGTKKVKGISGGTGNHDGSVYGKRTNQGEPVRDYTDADGKETVEAWECEEGCPVKAMDEQSGVSSGTGGETSGGTALGQGSGWNKHKNRTTGIVRHNDFGGASRFFRQVKG